MKQEHRFSTIEGIIFETEALGTIIAIEETSGLVPIVAREIGSQSNVSTGTVITILDSVDDVDTVTNPAPLSGGLDAETDFDYQDRFRTYLEGVAGSNLAGLETAARAVDGVTNASAFDVIPSGK